MSRRSAALLLAGAYAALAALFAAGAFRGFDQWAVERLMPGGEFRGVEPSVLDSVVPLLHSRWDNGYAIAANVVTLPAALVISAALAALLSRRLAVALVAAVAVEVLCKTVIAGPALYHDGLHIVPFDSSFPSGHALRVVVLAGGLAWWRARLRALAVVWAAAGVCLLVLAGWHTPTDVAGAVVLGLLALLGARSAGALRRRRLAARA